jgi:hypothetical protein
MDQPSARDKKRHHYIPITYLNKFADSAGNIFADRSDSVSDKALYMPPSAIAFERYYYSQPLPDGGQDNNTLEDFFGTIEGTWTPLLARIKAGSVAGSDLDALCTFMGLMRVRVPAVRDMVELLRGEQVKATTRFLDRQGLLPPKPKGFENILDDLVVTIDPHQSLLAMPDLSRGFDNLMAELQFEVIHNKSDVSFLTSDNPVVYFDPTKPEARVLPYQVRPPHGAIELLFPLDPRTLLCGRNGPSRLRHVMLQSSRDAKRINRFVARFGYRFVFSTDQTHAALIAKYASTSPVAKSTSFPAPGGGLFTLREYVFGPRPTKPKWKA